MKIKHKIDSSELYIYLQGELDEYFEKYIRSQIDSLIENNLNIQTVIFDMSGLTFMDSTGIGVLIGRYKKLKKLKIPCFITKVIIFYLFSINLSFKLLKLELVKISS